MTLSQVDVNQSVLAPAAGRRFAFYVATAQVLVVAGLAAGWLCLKVFLRAGVLGPLLWATLCGVLVYPLRDLALDSFERSVEHVRATRMPLLAAVVLHPVRRVWRTLHPSLDPLEPSLRAMASPFPGQKDAGFDITRQVQHRGPDAHEAGSASYGRHTPAVDNPERLSRAARASSRPDTVEPGSPASGSSAQVADVEQSTECVRHGSLPSSTPAAHATPKDDISTVRARPQECGPHQLRVPFAAVAISALLLPTLVLASYSIAIDALGTFPLVLAVRQSPAHPVTDAVSLILGANEMLSVWASTMSSNGHWLVHGVLVLIVARSVQWVSVRQGRRPLKTKSIVNVAICWAFLTLGAQLLQHPLTYTIAFAALFLVAVVLMGQQLTALLSSDHQSLVVLVIMLILGATVPVRFLLIAIAAYATLALGERALRRLELLPRIAALCQGLREEACPDWLWAYCLRYLEFEQTEVLRTLLLHKETLVTLFVVCGLVGVTVLLITFVSAQIFSEVTRLGVLGHKGVQMSAKVISTTVRDDFWATVNGTFPFAVEFICQHHHMAPWMKNNTHITRCVEGNVVVLPFGLPVPAAARRLFAPEPVCIREPIQYSCDLGELLDIHMSHMEDWARGEFYEVHVKSTLRSFLGQEFDFENFEVHISELASWAMQADSHAMDSVEVGSGPSALEQLLSVADGVGKDLISMESLQGALNVVLQTILKLGDWLSAVWSLNYLVVTLLMNFYSLGVNGIVFLTVLWYILSSHGQDGEYRPLQYLLNALLLSGQQREKVGRIIMHSVQSVLYVTLKLALFHATFTWATFHLFGVSKYLGPCIFSMLSAVMSVMAVVPVFLVAVPAAIQLYFTTSAWNASIFMAVHFCAWYSVDTIFYGQIKGINPYINGLSVIGGVYTTGSIGGAVVGPLVVVGLVCCFKTYSVLAEDPPMAYASEAYGLGGGSVRTGQHGTAILQRQAPRRDMATSPNHDWKHLTTVTTPSSGVDGRRGTRALHDEPDRQAADGGSARDASGEHEGCANPAHGQTDSRAQSTEQHQQGPQRPSGAAAELLAARAHSLFGEGLIVDSEVRIQSPVSAVGLQAAADKGVSRDANDGLGRGRGQSPASGFGQPEAHVFSPDANFSYLATPGAAER